MKTSKGWTQIHDDIKSLADCYHSYKQYLEMKAHVQSINRELPHPVRLVYEHCTCEHRTKSTFGVKDLYQRLDADVLGAGLLTPVMFDEGKHLEHPFDTSMQRHRFIANLQLSVPIDLFRYSPGGSCVTVAFIVQVSENRSSTDIQTQTARIATTIKPELPEFHTRAMKREFKAKLSRVAHLSPNVVDLIYKELTLDATTDSHPETQQRLRLISLGETGLLTDLRQLSTGRPTGTFDVFFQALGEIIEDVTAADDRRHNIAHMSEWLSLKDMMQHAISKCPAGTAIPSKSLVRLQFTPRNPYAHAALNFTSRFQVQHKIQRRQLRISHLDDHYCAAALNYLKCLAVELGENCALYFCDDKAKISFGEPGVVLSTGVRGKETLVPSSTTLAACDHDVHKKGSLTPSVILKCDVPSDNKQSFYRGQVITFVNDSTFESSTPFRHAASLVAAQTEAVPGALLLFTDGGTDHRNTIEAVKCSLICLFKRLDLDLLIAARCAPGQSWTNPAERVMSILNIALQNCALERARCDEGIEKKLKACGGSRDIRNIGKDNKDVKEAWQSCVRPLQQIISDRFKRLSLKEKQIQARQPVSDNEIQDMLDMLCTLFPGIDPDKLQKKHTQKLTTLQAWLESHTRQRQYSFQIKKCQDRDCCMPLRDMTASQLQWLPDPMLDDSGEHYKPFSSLYGSDTTEDDRPTLKTKPMQVSGKGQEVTKKTRQTRVQMIPLVPNDAELIKSSNDYTAQNARSVAICVECRKPRVVYCKSRFNSRQTLSLALLLSEYDYSCGSPLTLPGHNLHGKAYIRQLINCESLIELPYYSNENGVGRKDVCCFCAEENCINVDEELKKHYKTVLPICDACKMKGILPICQRPYGKKACKI